LEEALEAERHDYRDGYYRRDLGTKLGLLERLRVPRTRQGYSSQLLPRYQRRQASVNDLVREAFLRGVSTRQVGEVLEPVLGESYSPPTVSRIARGLDQAVKAFHQRRLRDEYLYIFLDGVVLRVRDGEGKVRRRWVLVAYGITAQGRRELLAYQLTRGESEASWTALLQGMFLRGLEGQQLRLVITDGSSGLRAAWGLVWPQVPLQRCWAHKLRNLVERAFREVRRRTRPMSSFTNPASCDRIVFGVISHLNRSWDKKPLKEFTQKA
jgi:putative transposase